ncbi:hypothetical protein LCGC14_2155270, partial [marine sediment metagenome]
MVRFKSKCDLVVTPNHNMFGRPRHGMDYEVTTAASLWGKGEFYIPTTCSWEGTVPDKVTLNKIVPKRDRGNSLRYPEVDIDCFTMASFLGWVLSDGSICKGKSSGT